MISDKTNSAINKIIATAFNGNALFDNIAYNLDVVFNMPLASDIVHHKVAHWLPAPFADDIQTFQSQRNTKPIRPAVIEQSKTYSVCTDCFKDALNYFVGLESDFKNAIKIADEENEVESRIFLENTYIDNILKFTKQMTIWSKKIVEHEESIGLQSFDKDIESFTMI